MKRILAFVICSILLLGLCACKTAETPTQTNAATQPETTVPAKSYAGLTATFVGDSITNGAKLNNGESRYWQLLQKDLGLGEVTGMGVNGSCYSTLSEFGMDHEPLVTRYQNIPDTDLIFIFMGTNDFGRATPLGSVEDREDVSFQGAMNKVLDEVKKAHPESKIILLTPIIRFDKNVNGLGYTLDDYIAAIKEVAEKQEVLVIDNNALTKDSLPEGVFADTVHPDKFGHQILAGAIKTWLEENIDAVLN